MAKTTKPRGPRPHGTTGARPRTAKAFPRAIEPAKPALDPALAQVAGVERHAGIHTSIDASFAEDLAELGWPTNVAYSSELRSVVGAKAAHKRADAALHRMEKARQLALGALDGLITVAQALARAWTAASADEQSAAPAGLHPCVPWLRRALLMAVFAAETARDINGDGWQLCPALACQHPLFEHAAEGCTHPAKGPLPACACRMAGPRPEAGA